MHVYALKLCNIEPHVTSRCDWEVVVSVHGGEEQLCVLMASTKAHTLPKRLSYVLDKVHLEDIQGNKYQVRGFLRALQVVKTPGRFYLPKASLVACWAHTVLFLDIVISLPAANEACNHPRAHLQGPSGCCELHRPGTTGLSLPRQEETQ